VLIPVVHAAPALHALQVPVLSQTPAPDEAVQAVATATVLHAPVEHEWHAPHVVAQQTPDTQWPLVHWLSEEQVFPSAMVGAQAPPAPQ
jgi:hypothetical protein